MGEKPAGLSGLELEMVRNAVLDANQCAALALCANKQSRPPDFNNFDDVANRLFQNGFTDESAAVTEAADRLQAALTRLGDPDDPINADEFRREMNRVLKLATAKLTV